MKTHINKDTINQQTGRRVKRCRQMCRMGQKQLASHLNISFQQVQKYEKGENGIPLWRLYVIASALNVSITDLLAEQENEPVTNNDNLGLSLHREFVAIDNPDMRRSLVDMAQTMAQACAFQPFQKNTRGTRNREIAPQQVGRAE